MQDDPFDILFFGPDANVELAVLIKLGVLRFRPMINSG